MDIRKILIVLLTVVAPAMLRAVTPEEVENVHLRDSRRYVSDMAGVLSPQALSQADSILGDIRRQTSAEVVMVIVDDLSGEDIDDWSTELFSLWGVGKKDRDNGVLLVTSMADRENVIRTGYGAEPVLPDVVCWNIIDNKMKLRVFGAVQNPFVITKYKGLDPELTYQQGIDSSVYPRPITVTLGLVANF